MSPPRSLKRRSWVPVVWEEAPLASADHGLLHVSRLAGGKIDTFSTLFESICDSADNSQLHHFLGSTVLRSFHGRFHLGSGQVDDVSIWRTLMTYWHCRV